MPRVVKPGVGATILSGFVPTVTVGNAVTVLPGTGQLLLAGFVPSVLTPEAVRPGAGTLLLTGFVPTVTVSGGGVTAAPGTGQLTLAGLAPTVQIIVRPWTTSGGSPPVPVGYYKREYVGRPGKARDYTKVDAPTPVEVAAVTAVLRPPAMEEPSVGIARALASAQRHGGMQHEWQRTQQAAAHVAAMLLLGEFDD